MSPDLHDQRALVTGASSGIGAAFARQLAGWGSNLVITARRLDRLEALAAELREAHAGVQIDCVQMDLSRPTAPAELYTAATDVGQIDILINNAGFGQYAEFTESAWQRNADMLQLNVTSLVELTHRFLRDAVGRDERAYVLNVASVAAYQPVPFLANYAAGKAYVRVFSESIAAELKGSNASVTCVLPGATKTEFFENADQETGRSVRMTMIGADKVARIGLKAMLRGRRSLVTGGINKLNTFLLRFIPRRMASAAASKVVGGRPDATRALPSGEPKI